MAVSKSVFCDINIFLDIFLERQPFYDNAAAIFKEVEEGKLEGYISALSFPILNYLLFKQTSREKAVKVLEKIRIVFKVAPVDERTVDLALASDFKDFEDAIQYYCAANAKAGCLITRNKSDYCEDILPVLLPEEFLATYMQI